MKKIDFPKRTRPGEGKDISEESDYPAYKPYPPDEDIYTKDEQETTIDPEDLSQDRSYPKTGVKKEDEAEADVSELDLDIPGVDLDDEMESVGSEDEENNYYSITDDNFDDLEDILES